MVDVNGKGFLILLSFWLMEVDQTYEAIKQVNQEEVNNVHQQNQSLMQRSLRVMALINPPFIELDSKLVGIDMLILQAIAERLDLNIELTTTYHSQYLSRKSRSKNYDLLIGGLTRDQVNSSQFIPTAVYFQGDITLCVQRAQLFPQWTNVFFIIKDFQTWMAGVILFTWGIILLYIMTMFEPKPMDAWKTIVFSIQTMLGVPSNFKPKGSIIRVLYFATLFIQVLIVTLYNAYFISFITRRISGKQISTIDEAIRMNYRVHSDQETIILLNELGIGKRFGDLKTCENMDSCLNHLQYNANMAVVVSRIFFDTSNHSNVYCFDRTEALMSHSIVFMIQRDTPNYIEFIEVFNRLLRSGLIAKWIKDRYIHKFAPNNENPPYESIKLYQAIGPFAVCSPILLLAFLAAIAEQIISWQLLKNRKSRFWRLADRFVDGQRHYVLLSDKKMKKKKIVPHKKLLKISKKIQRNTPNESTSGTVTVRYERFIISGDAVATATLLGEIE